MTHFLSESESFSKILQSLKNKSVLVLGHRRPDGDCIGSQVALTRVLNQEGVLAKAVNADPVPRTLQKFLGDTTLLKPDEVKGNDYLIITVDCADHKRVGIDLIDRFPTVFLNVDVYMDRTVQIGEHSREYGPYKLSHLT